MLDISVHGLEAIQAKLQAIQAKSGNLRPALLEIGEEVVNFNKRRFVTMTSPDGVPWQENSPVTLAHKSGSMPLTDSGHLADSINYQLVGDTSVEIAPHAPQAAMMQFGGTKAEFPNLWGDIPARPYLGISESESQVILTMLEDYLI